MWHVWRTGEVYTVFWWGVWKKERQLGAKAWMAGLY